MPDLNFARQFDFTKSLGEFSQEICKSYNQALKNEELVKLDEEQRLSQARREAVYIILCSISHLCSAFLPDEKEKIAKRGVDDASQKDTAVLYNVLAFDNFFKGFIDNAKFFNKCEQAIILQHFINKAKEFLNQPEVEYSTNTLQLAEKGHSIQNDDSEIITFEKAKDKYFYAEFKDNFSKVSLTSLITGGVIITLGIAIAFPHLWIGLAIIGIGLALAAIPMAIEIMMTRKKAASTQKQEALDKMNSSICTSYQSLFAKVAPKGSPSESKAESKEDIIEDNSNKPQ